MGDVDALRGATGDRVFHLSRHVGPRGMTRTRRSFKRNLNYPCQPWTNEAIAGRALQPCGSTTEERVGVKGPGREEQWRGERKRDSERNGSEGQLNIFYVYAWVVHM